LQIQDLGKLPRELLKQLFAAVNTIVATMVRLMQKKKHGAKLSTKGVTAPEQYI
jgi:hypothetical protein